MLSNETQELIAAAYVAGHDLTEEQRNEIIDTATDIHAVLPNLIKVAVYKAVAAPAETDPAAYRAQLRSNIGAFYDELGVGLPAQAEVLKAELAELAKQKASKELALWMLGHKSECLRHVIGSVEAHQKAVLALDYTHHEPKHIAPAPLKVVRATAAEGQV